MATVYHISNGHVFNITDDHKIPILPKGEEKSPTAEMKNGFEKLSETKMSKYVQCMCTVQLSCSISKMAIVVSSFVFVFYLRNTMPLPRNKTTRTKK